MGWWTTLVNAVANLIVSAGDALGGNLGAGVFVTTMVVRVALIPVLLPLAARTRDRQRVVERMKPELRALEQQHHADADRLHREIGALHDRHGIKLVDTAALLVAFIQLPVLIALFQAVYHVSQGTPLATGGLLTGLAAAGLSVLALVLGGQSGAKPLLVLSGVLPIGIALWLGSGIGIYLVAFYGGSVLQSALMRRRPVVLPPAPAAPDVEAANGTGD
jgi:membrane protein insertase Oxa1/YidC/SpoIIIJ